MKSDGGLDSTLAAVVIALLLLCFLIAHTGCDRAMLTRDQKPSPSSTPNPWYTPTPPPFVTVHVWGPSVADGCTMTGGGGNATVQAPYVDDPDDAVNEGDSWACFWPCAIQPPWVPTPMAIAEVWDFDPPSAPTLYDTMIQVGPCGSPPP